MLRRLINRTVGISLDRNIAVNSEVFRLRLSFLCQTRCLSSDSQPNMTQNSPGKILNQLQNTYKQKFPPTQLLKSIFQQCEDESHIKIAVAALSLYQTKGNPIKEASPFVDFCLRADHPALAVEILANGNRKGEYVISDGDSVRLPPKIGSYVRRGLSHQGVGRLIDHLGFQVREGHEEESIELGQKLIASLDKYPEYEWNKSTSSKAIRLLVNTGHCKSARLFLTRLENKDVKVGPMGTRILASAEKAMQDRQAVAEAEAQAQADAEAAVEGETDASGNDDEKQ
jgi:hypothetical protein